MERLDLVNDAIEWIEGQLMEYECDYGDTPELRRLVVCAQLGRNRLSHPGTERDLIQQLVCVERHYCMALAWINWQTYTRELSMAKGVAPVDEHLMGCITTSADMAGKLAQAGIPVWYMRQSYEVAGSCGLVVNIVELTSPNDIAMTDRPASSSIYEGIPGTKQLLAIYRGGHVCADVEAIPLPQDYAAEPSDDTRVSNVHEKPPVVSFSNTSSGAGPSRHNKPAITRPEPCEYTE